MRIPDPPKGNEGLELIYTQVMACVTRGCLAAHYSSVREPIEILKILAPEFGPKAEEIERFVDAFLKLPANEQAEVSATVRELEKKRLA